MLPSSGIGERVILNAYINSVLFSPISQHPEVSWKFLRKIECLINVENFFFNQISRSTNRFLTLGIALTFRSSVGRSLAARATLVASGRAHVSATGFTPLHSMHVDHLGCIYHVAARLGDARLHQLPSRVLRVCMCACICEKGSFPAYVHTHIFIPVPRRSADPVSRVDNGGRHAEMRAATVLRLCLRSVAGATPSVFIASCLIAAESSRKKFFWGDKKLQNIF